MIAKRPQLRRCGACHKPGHNKATCPELTSSAHQQTSTGVAASPAPVKFFIHHVNTPAPTSAHVVDLRAQKEDLWKKIDSAAPETPNDSLFHTYHARPDAAERPISPKLFSDLHRPKAAPEFHIPKVIEKPIKEKKISWRKKTDHKKTVETLKKLVPSRIATATVLIFALSFTIPGPLKGYFESLAATKDEIAANSTAGFLALQESAAALKNANLTSAESSTAEALGRFHAALGSLTTKHVILQTVARSLPFVSGQIESRERVLLAGEQIAIGNTYLLSGLKAAEADGQPLTKRLDRLVESLRYANPSYADALKNLDGVDPKTLPAEYREQFGEFKILFNDLVQDLSRITALNETFQEIFGGKGLRRYLLIFQNPAELRPTGGFMGSFAVLDVKDGAIASLNIPAGGTYDLQGQLSEYVIPPLPLTINNKRWEFQDANWFPDFEASAKKILWFYNHSRSATADGVIAVNASVLERLLSILGPVTDQNRGIELTSSTALTSIQKVVETGPEKLQNKPKQILADLAPQLISSIQNSDGKNLLSLLGSLDEALDEKEIQAYFTDSAAQKQIAAAGWSGTILNPDSSADYLMVVNTNLQGQKSDAKIKQTISHQAVVASDGTVTDTVTIIREHTGTPGEQFYGATNVDYLRVYVPKGSKLISASGFSWPDERNFRAPENWYVADSDLAKYETETSIDPSSGTRITEEFDKTAFGNWVVTAPGETSRIEFSYSLPFKMLQNEPADETLWKKLTSSLNEPISSYQLVVQKQSGITANFESQIIFPEGWEPEWSSGENSLLASNGLNIQIFPLRHDEVWGVIMKKPNK